MSNENKIPADNEANIEQSIENKDMDPKADISGQPNTENTVPGSPSIVLNKPNEDIDFVCEVLTKTRLELQKVIIGQDELINFLLIGILSKGHVLVEGVPGIAKTLTVKLLSKALDNNYKRIQFTPDLMPSDVIGTNVFNMKTSEFNFRQGPVFSNIILIDEINRAPAKTQAALFEVMEERQVTVDGTTYPLGFPLYIVATQNPIEQEGTYKLPEAQLDRFLFRLKVKYPDLDEELQILQRFNEKKEEDLSETIEKTLNTEVLKRCMDIIDKVQIKKELVEYIARIIHQTRTTGDLFLGASPRASLAIMHSAKAVAVLQGRDFVTPEDIQYVAYPVLNHRIILSPEREMEGHDAEDIITELIKKVEVPR